MQMFFKEEVSIYHQMFSRESQKSNSGLHILEELVQKIHEGALNSTNAHEIQRSIRLLSIFAEILETFNGSVETLVSSIDEDIFNKVAANSPNGACLLRVKDWFADLHSYRIGNVFTGIVSFILNAESKLCYVKDMTKHANVDFEGCLESAFEGTPVYGQVFAVKINQKFMRAIRLDSKSTNMSMRVRLIDIGETILLSPNVYKFNLVEHAKRLPPMAILCRVEKLNGKPLNVLDSLYKKTYNVKILEICVNMLEVELNTVIQQEDEEMNESIQKSFLECNGNGDQNGFYAPLDSPVTPPTPNSFRSGAATPNSNPFLNHLPAPSTHPVQMSAMTNGHGTHTQSVMAKKEPIVPSPKEEKLEVSPRQSLPPVPPRQRPKVQSPIKIPTRLVRRSSNVGATENGIHTNKHANQTMEKFPNNEPKPVAPKEDNEPKLNGAHPKMSQTPSENGFMSVRPTCEVLPTPNKGDEISITPTHIINVDHFYVQYTDWYSSFEDYQFTTLQKVAAKPLSYIPKLGDFVLARYSDSYIYRGRVEVVNQNYVTVLYVDYGNQDTINIDGLFEWDPVCNTFPFQAILCRLANIHCVPAISEQTLYTFIHSKYLNQPCKAIVMDNTENALQVKLMSPHGRDVVDEINTHFHPECIV